MDPRELPVVGQICNTEKDFFDSFAPSGGKRLLCVGFSESELRDLVVKYKPASITLLTNWVDHEDARVSRYPLVIGDITKRTEFPDDRFDAVLTLSVLEHLSDLKSSFDEMTRLTRPGGHLLHLFGPAWSCAYGHHFYANPVDPLLNFSFWKMPAHMHLLCSREEIATYYARLGYDERAIASVQQWFFDTPLINRVFYDEYEKVMRHPQLQLDRVELMYNELPRSHVENLRRTFPGARDFATYGGKYSLVVSK